MYISLKNTDNTEKIINTFKDRGIELEVSRHSIITFIEADETELNSFTCYIPFYAKQVVFFDRSKELGEIIIPFEEIDCIYSL